MKVPAASRRHVPARRLARISALASLTVALAACGGGLAGDRGGGGGGGDDAGKPIVLGMLTPLSGSSSAIGPNMTNGAKLAVTELNDKGGVLGRTLELNVQDEACDPKTAVAGANKLVSQGIVASVGGYCSGATLPTLPVFNRAGIPMVIPAANSNELVQQKLDNVFLINGTGTQQAAAAMDWMTKRGATRVAVMHDNTSYSKNIADLTAVELRRPGGPDLAVNEVVTPGESDYSANVTQALSKRPDFVYWTGYYQEGGLISRQFRQAGYKGDLMVADGSVDPQLIKIAGTQAATGVFATMTQTPQTIPGAQDWIARYKKQFGNDPGPYSTQSYDAVRVVAEAIKNANSTDGKQIISALENINGLPLFSGPLKFTPQHTLASGGFQILVVKNGTFTLADALR